MAILHRTRTVPTLMPRYTERFRCIGPACEDTCCASWSIHIDKKTYKAYRQETGSEVGKLLSKNLLRLDASDNSATYAAIQPVGKNRQCPAMQDGLCAIHSQLGESYISNLCFSYPRRTRSMAGQIEQALTLSCPEAARLALLAEDAFEFVEGSIAVREAGVEPIEPHQGLALDTMNEVRIFCINLMRTRELALWQRMTLLGVLCDALVRHCETGQQAAVPALLAQFAGLVESGEVLAPFEALAPDHRAQAMVFATLWAEKGFDTDSAFQQAIIERISARLGADEYGQASAETLVASYTRGLARLDDALAQAPFLLENYLLNELFSRLFPFNAPNAYDSFLVLTARFGLLRLLLAAECSGEGPLPSVSELLAVVHLHCRRFQHDTDYTTRVHGALRDSDWASLDKVTTLLRT